MAEASQRTANLPFRAAVSAEVDAMALPDGALAVLLDPSCWGGARTVVQDSPKSDAKSRAEWSRKTQAEDMIDTSRSGVASTLFEDSSAHAIRSNPNGESRPMAEASIQIANIPFGNAAADGGDAMTLPDGTFPVLPDPSCAGGTRTIAPDMPECDAKPRIDMVRNALNGEAFGFGRDSGVAILIGRWPECAMHPAPNEGVPLNG